MSRSSRPAETSLKFPSGRDHAAEMVEGQKLAEDWQYDAVAIGYPGRIARPHREPGNLGRGWVGFDFETAFGVPSRSSTTPPCRRSAATRAAMLFLGLGTGLGSALSSMAHLPMELAHLPYKNGTYRGLPR